jgi:hypothetical protein
MKSEIFENEKKKKRQKRASQRDLRIVGWENMAELKNEK